MGKVCPNAYYLSPPLHPLCTSAQSPSPPPAAHTEVRQFALAAGEGEGCYQAIADPPKWSAYNQRELEQVQHVGAIWPIAMVRDFYQLPGSDQVRAVVLEYFNSLEGPFICSSLFIY